MRPQRHFPTLDAMRGLAAFSVVMSHVAYSLPATPGMAVNPFIRGHEAVMLFFLLSGFVLALPAWQGRALPYAAFVARRVGRIAVPYWAAMLLAAGLAALWHPAPVVGGAKWLQVLWTHPIPSGLVASSMSLVGCFDTYPLNPVVWSLVHEMRLSLAFPLVMLLARVGPWWLWLGLGPALSIGCDALGAAPASGAELVPSLLGTLRYVGFFVVGAALARDPEALVRRFRAWPGVVRAGVLAAGGLLYLYANILVQRAHGPLWAIDWGIGLGATALLVGALASRRMGAVLAWRPLGWLGRVSFSLYLLHPLVLKSVLIPFHGAWPPVALAALAFALSAIAAELGYRLLEAPGMRAGRAIAQRLMPAEIAREASLETVVAQAAPTEESSVP